MGPEYNDTLGGNNAVNSLFGIEGNDYLTCRGGKNKLYSGAGHDRLNGGEGADILNFGSGIDRADYSTASAGVRADIAYRGTNT